MCCKYQRFSFTVLVPKCKQPYLLSAKFCSKLPNVFLQFLKKFWVITLFGKVNVIKYFLYCLFVQACNEFICFFLKPCLKVLQVNLFLQR